MGVSNEVAAVYAQVGLVAFGVLGLLHGVVWRALRVRWGAMLAAAFTLGALNYGFDFAITTHGYTPHPLGSLTVTVGFALMTLAVIDYLELPARAAKAVAIAVVLALVVVAVLRSLGWVPRVASQGVIASVLATQAVLTAWAMRREPRSGHGLVFVALLTYPVSLIWAVANGVDPVRLRYLVVVPASVLGATMLTTGLLRAQRRAYAEAQQREQAEQALQQLNDTLEHQVAQRTEDLREMVAGLESFNRSVSHDLRGPLGGIAGVSRLAGEALSRGDLATVARLLPVVTAQAESSSQLVAALLALARVGEVEIEPQVVDLQAFIEDTLAQLRLTDAAVGAVQIEVGPMPEVSADPALLRQVLVNLVGNAAKYSAAVDTPRIEITAQASEPGWVTLQVSDNGVGFDDAQAARLFEPFQRLHGVQYQGHGVGLSIVRRIVERHGGRVWAQSAPGQGARFFVSLPAAASARPAGALH
jgi:signal transduction histidine kinase